MRILAILGPSGSGKSTLVSELHCRGLVQVTPSWTTRPRRDNEGAATVEHRFVSDNEFTDLQEAGAFLEAVQLFGLPYRYGLPPVDEPQLGRAATIMVRAPLMQLVSRHFPSHIAYQIEDSYDRVHARIHTRRDAHGNLGSRLEGYEAERLEGRVAAHRIFVNGGSITELTDSVATAIREDFFLDRTEEAWTTDKSAWSGP